MNRLGYLAIAVVLAGMALTAWVFTRPSEQESAKQVRLQLQWFDQAQFAGFYVAQQKGFYRDEGLNVVITPGGYATLPVDLVESDQADFALAPADVALRGIGMDKPITMLGAVFDRSMVCFMSKADAKIRTPVDLVGKVVGVYQGFDTDNVLSLMLSKLGIARSDVDIRPAGQLAAFQKGDFDVWPAYRFNEPLLMRAQDVAVECMKPEDFGIQYYSDSLIVSDKFLSEQPETANAFVRASQRGWQYALDRPLEVIDLMYQAKINLPDDAQTRQHQLAMLTEVLNYIDRPAGEELLSIERAKLMEMAKSLVEQGILPPATNERILEKVRFDYLGTIQ